MTYQQAYDKIIQAYFRDEIKPYDGAFCFCGTLCDNRKNWQISRGVKHRSFAGYEGEDFVRMESALLNTIEENDRCFLGYGMTEDDLFRGMCAALEVLKQIHIERGEIIDEAPVFVKRQLV